MHWVSRPVSPRWHRPTKEFKATVEKAGLDLNLRTGEQVQALIQKAYATPKPTVDLLKSVLKQ